MHKKDFKTSGYFSASFILFGISLILIAILVGSTSMIGAGLILLVSFIILTTHYRFRVDLKNKTYHDYLWILGMKYGEKGTFEKIEYLFLKPSRVSQTMHVRVVSSSVTKDVVDAYIRFTPENKIHLFTKESKHDSLVKLREIAHALGTRVVDYSSVEHAE